MLLLLSIGFWLMNFGSIFRVFTVGTGNNTVRIGNGGSGRSHYAKDCHPEAHLHRERQHNPRLDVVASHKALGGKWAMRCHLFILRRVETKRFENHRYINVYIYL